MNKEWRIEEVTPIQDGLYLMIKFKHRFDTDRSMLISNSADDWLAAWEAKYTLEEFQKVFGNTVKGQG